MSLLGLIRDRLRNMSVTDFSAGEREDHWYGLRLSAILQVALINSETDDEFEKCFQRIVGAFGHVKRERARSWLHNFLFQYLSAGEFSPRPRALAQRFLQHAPRRYRLNPVFYAQYLADYAVSPRENQARLDRLREEFHLEILWRDPLADVKNAERYRMEEPDRIQFAFFVPTLASQLSLYPMELAKRACLSRIVLCDGLHYDGRPMRGLAVYDQTALFLNMAGGYVKESSCTLIHHEFFHLIDKFALKLPDDDTEWASLNSAAFRYGISLEGIGDRLAVTEAYPGFMTAYATTSSREDKAELFGHMIVNCAAVEARAQADKKLAAKMELMKRRLESVCPALDVSFWDERRQADFWASCKPDSAKMSAS